MKTFISTAFCVAFLHLAPLSNTNAASLTIITNDQAGEGFNDMTPFSPTGGNPATTLGQARLNAFRYAAAIIEKSLPHTAKITINASMDPMGGSANSATLASAGAKNMVFNFDNAKKLNTLYPVALANYLYGGDVSPDTPDIVARINSDIDSPNIMENSRWYYGLDANPPSNYPDFVTVLTHELLHGLGFSNTVNLSTGEMSFAKNDIYSDHFSIENDFLVKAYTQATDTQRADAHVSRDTLLWSGDRTNYAALSRLSSGIKNQKVKMYTPTQLEYSSSVSHFDSTLYPNETMEPFYTGPNHSLGLAAHALSDMGWGNLADLGIRVERAKETESIQSQQIFRITVTNSDYDSASDVMMTLPVNTNVVIQAAQSAYGKCSVISNQYTCALGDIHTGGQKTIYLALAINPLNNTELEFTVAGNSVDPMVTNNTARYTLASSIATNIAVENTSSNSASGGKFDIFLLFLLLPVLLVRAALK